LHSGGSADVTLEGLRQRYQRLHQINLAMASRLKAKPSKDASVNADVLRDPATKVGAGETAAKAFRMLIYATRLELFRPQ